jgi:hypothetical protein
MGKKVMVSFYCVVCILLFINCSMGDNNKIDHRKHGNSLTYYYEMDKKMQKTFFQKINNIKYGDSVKRVKNILGEPSDDIKLVDKTGVFKARILDYSIKILNKDQVNDKYDRSVSFVFDIGDKLTKIESNVEGFKYTPK